MCERQDQNMVDPALLTSHQRRDPAVAMQHGVRPLAVEDFAEHT